MLHEPIDIGITVVQWNRRDSQDVGLSPIAKHSLCGEPIANVSITAANTKRELRPTSMSFTWCHYPEFLRIQTVEQKLDVAG